VQRNPPPKKQPSTPSKITESTFSSISSLSGSQLPPQDAETLEASKMLPSHTAPNYVSSTSAKHAQIAYDPLTCTATNTVTLKQTTYNKSHHPIGFILANESMPGALKPAAGRYDNYENELRAANVLEDMQGKEYVICPAHADVVSVTALQTDHAFSSSEILKRQIKLIDELNKNQPFTESFIEDFNLEEFFIMKDFIMTSIIFGIFVNPVICINQIKIR
jgi:hypothetical protein